MPFTFEEAIESPKAFSFEDVSESEERDESRNVGSAARRQALLEEQAALEREGRRTGNLEMLATEAERLVEPFTGRGMMNQPARAMGLASGLPVEDPFTGPIVQFPRPTGTSAWAGVGQLASDLATGMTDPNMLVALPAAANPLGLALFSGDIGRHVPGQVEEAAISWRVIRMCVVCLWHCEIAT